MPYTYEKVSELEDQEMVGTHQCVALVRRYAGAPVTSAWRMGDAGMGNASLKKGSAITTFIKGRYANHAHGNHAALFLRLAPGGMVVIDQWKTKKGGKITSRFILAQGRDKKGTQISE